MTDIEETTRQTHLSSEKKNSIKILDHVSLAESVVSIEEKNEIKTTEVIVDIFNAFGNNCGKGETFFDPPRLNFNIFSKIKHTEI